MNKEYLKKCYIRTLKYQILATAILLILMMVFAPCIVGLSCLDASKVFARVEEIKDSLKLNTSVMRYVLPAFWGLIAMFVAWVVLTLIPGKNKKVASIVGMIACGLVIVLLFYIRYYKQDLLTILDLFAIAGDVPTRLVSPFFYVTLLFGGYAFALASMLDEDLYKKIAEFVKKNTMVLVLVLVAIFFAYQTRGKILLPQNINNLFAQNAYVFVLATGMLLCILTGGNIDLSVGSVVCFVGAIGAVMMSKGVNMWLAVLAMLAIGLAIGSWQAFWIAYVKVPPFITTLSGMLVFRGLSNVVLQGKTLAVKDASFVRLFGGGADCYVPDIFHGEGINILCLVIAGIATVAFVTMTFVSRAKRLKKGYEVGTLISTIIKSAVIVALIAFFSYKLAKHKGLPTALIWVALIIAIYSYITSKTTIGRHFYAVGGNELATKLSGINTNRIYFVAYANMGLLAAFAGMLTIARLTSAQPTYGQNYEMDAIGSCFIGGASAYGGIGTVPGVIVGAILMGVINIGMSIMGVDANYQKVVKGLVLLAAVIFDVVSKRKQN